MSLFKRCVKLLISKGIDPIMLYGGACGRFQSLAGRNSFEVPGYRAFKLLDFTDHSYQFWSPGSTCRPHCMNMKIKYSYEIVTAYQPTRLMKLETVQSSPSLTTKISRSMQLCDFMYSVNKDFKLHCLTVRYLVETEPFVF
jgi:hypothetical protein